MTRADSKEINLKSANEMKEFSVINSLIFISWQQCMVALYLSWVLLIFADVTLAWRFCVSHFFIITAEIFMLIIPWERRFQLLWSSSDSWSVKEFFICFFTAWRDFRENFLLFAFVGFCIVNSRDTIKKFILSQQLCGWLGLTFNVT